MVEGLDSGGGGGGGGGVAGVAGAAGGRVRALIYAEETRPRTSDDLTVKAVRDQSAAGELQSERSKKKRK